MAHQTLASALCAVLVLSAPSRVGGPQGDTAVWSYVADADIQLVALHPLGIPRVFMVTEDALLCLDAETGAVRWTRSDVKKLPAGGFVALFTPTGVDSATGAVTSRALGILSRDRTLEVIDLETGEKRWDSGPWAVDEVRGYLLVPGQNALLVLTKTTQAKSALRRVDVVTGQVMWQNDSVFAKAPELLNMRVGSGVFFGTYPPTLLGHQEPLVLSDSSLILYLGEDGPIRIEGHTGKVLWRGVVLRGKEVPVRINDYAGMLATDSVLFVPSENKLIALRVSEGAPVWSDPPSYSRGVLTSRYKDWTRAVGLWLTGHGLLVSVAKVNPTNGSWGDVSFDLLDPATSRSRWPARVEDVTTWPVIRGDTAYLVARGKLLAVDVPSGASRLVAALVFRGGAPTRLRLRDEGFMLSGAQSYALVGYDGTIKYQKHYARPGVSFFRAAAAAVSESELWSPRAQVSERYVFLVTDAPDAAGREGLSVVRLDQTTGSEAGRVWFAARPKWHGVDPASSTVFVQADNRALSAFRF